LRELYGIWLFISAVARLLAGGRHLVVMDNLGCIFILGGVLPAFALGGRQWGEFVSGGSPDPELQAYAIALHDLQLEHGFTLVPVWRPRAENVRADFLSRVSLLQLHDYQLRPDLFRALDEAWGPHTVDRFSTFESCQPLRPPHGRRFCSLFFHPAALWTDALAAPWGAKVNWAFPPFPLVAGAVSAFLEGRAAGTLIIPDTRTAIWWPSLRAGTEWVPEITAWRALGPAGSILLRFSAADHGLARDTPLLALRFGGRRAPLPPRPS
jgi:hypothetical protein